MEDIWMALFPTFPAQNVPSSLSITPINMFFWGVTKKFAQDMSVDSVTYSLIYLRSTLYEYKISGQVRCNKFSLFSVLDTMLERNCDFSSNDNVWTKFYEFFSGYLEFCWLCFFWEIAWNFAYGVFWQPFWIAWVYWCNKWRSADM